MTADPRLLAAAELDRAALRTTLGIGDRVRVKAGNDAKLAPGATGRVVGFVAETGRPLLDVDGRGRVAVAVCDLAGIEVEEERVVAGKWTPAQRAKYETTMAARREERQREDAAAATGLRERLWGENGRAVDDAAPRGTATPENGPGVISAVVAPPEPKIEAVASIPASVLANGSALAGMRDELAASVAALRRAVASAAIEGEAVGTVQRLVLALGALEQSAAEVSG